MSQPTTKRKSPDDAPPPAPPGVRTAPPPDGAVRGAPEDGKREPEFGTARPLDAAGELPRVVHELERAAPGTTRYKVAFRSHDSPKHRYVLAAPGDEAGAVACATKANGLDRAEPPPLTVVTRLPD